MAKANTIPGFIPDDLQRETVKNASGLGMTNAQIACLIINPKTCKHIDRDTLEKYFREELEVGGPRLINKVANNLVNLAQGEGSSAVTAAMFYLKTQARWTELQRIEISGPDGKELSDARSILASGLIQTDAEGGEGETPSATD